MYVEAIHTPIRITTKLHQNYNETTTKLQLNYNQTALQFRCNLHVNYNALFVDVK